VTPANDKTLRGIFSRRKNDQWLDEREYSNKFNENSFDIGQGSKKLIFEAMLRDIKTKNKYLHEDYDGHDFYEYVRNLTILFPEIDLCKEYKWYDDGEHEQNSCVRCGKHLHFFNFTNGEICIQCEDDMKPGKFILE
jgi:hypothetical protein